MSFNGLVLYTLGSLIVTLVTLQIGRLRINSGKAGALETNVYSATVLVSFCSFAAGCLAAGIGLEAP